MELRKNNLQQKVNPMAQPQPTKKEKLHWTYYFIDTTDCYVKTITNTSKAGNSYNSYYFYKAEKDGTEIFKFSTPTWNCFYVWDGEDRYLLLRVDKSDTNEHTIKMVNQLESIKAMDWVKKFDGGYVFGMLDSDEPTNSTDCEDYDD